MQIPATGIETGYFRRAAETKGLIAMEWRDRIVHIDFS
ncbi:hypothetical protein DESC_720224 [Desulfosarcina cetonica]|nr:hypothetical protein DESC_720224 [Desulfosarcina cetonica]